MRLGLALALTGLALALAGGAVAVAALGSGEGTRLAAHGLAVELPSGWEGEIYLLPRAEPGGPLGPPLLKAASFDLPGGDDDFGNEALRRMGPDDLRIVLIEYLEPADPSRWAGTFPPLEGELAVGPDDFTSFEGIPDDHAFARRSFSTGGRYFDVWVDFGSTPAPAESLGEATAILASLEVG